MSCPWVTILQTLRWRKLMEDLDLHMFYSCTLTKIMKMKTSATPQSWLSDCYTFKYTSIHFSVWHILDYCFFKKKNQQRILNPRLHPIKESLNSRPEYLKRLARLCIFQHDICVTWICNLAVNCTTWIHLFSQYTAHCENCMCDNNRVNYCI